MYTPLNGEYGLSVLYPAMRDYLATDEKLVSMLGGPPNECIIQEGFYTLDTPVPCIIVSTIADGDTAAGQGTTLLRLIAYVVDRERGYYRIENIIPRVKRLFESRNLFSYLTFPPSVGFAILGIEAPGTTASTTMPSFRSEGRGVYSFCTLIDIDSDLDVVPEPEPEEPPPTGGDIQTFVTVAATGIIYNPYMGLEDWRGAPDYVDGIDEQVRYQRFPWKDLESDTGVINLNAIETFLTTANAEGQRAGIGIQAFIPYGSPTVPAVVPTTLYNGLRVPQWENPTFKSEMQVLLNTIGSTYANDPRLAYVEIRIYGSYGEWHMYGFPNDLKASDQAKRDIIDAHRVAFPNGKLLMMTDDDYGLGYAMADPDIGLRRDSWGHPTQFDAIKQKASWALAKDRWKTKPVIVEPYRSETFVFDTAAALRQVSEYHITGAGNANINGLYADLPQSDKDNWQEIVKKLGYRYQLKSASFDFSEDKITTIWDNLGVAPSYRPVTTKLILVGATTIEIEIDSELEKLEPGSKSIITTLPSIPSGSYALHCEATVEGSKINLAQTGQQPSGDYLLGTLVVN